MSIAIIGIKGKLGGIKYIKCLNRGTPSWTGAILHAHYLNESKIRKLINIGELEWLHELVADEINPPTQRHCRFNVHGYYYNGGKKLPDKVAKKVKDIEDCRINSAAPCFTYPDFAYIYDSTTKQWNTYIRDNIHLKWVLDNRDYTTCILDLVNQGTISKPKWL